MASKHGHLTNLSCTWIQWHQGFDLYLIAAGITNDNQKKVLIHCRGEDLQELRNELPQNVDELLQAK